MHPVMIYSVPVYMSIHNTTNYFILNFLYSWHYLIHLLSKVFFLAFLTSCLWSIYKSYPLILFSPQFITLSLFLITSTLLFSLFRLISFLRHSFYYSFVIMILYSSQISFVFFSFYVFCTQTLHILPVQKFNSLYFYLLMF